MNNRHTLWFVLHVYMIIGMDYHNQQVPIVCGQRLTKYRAKKSISYESKAFSAELKIAFDINTSGDDVNIHPEMFCIHCKLSMQRTISVPSQRECITNVQ